MKKIILASSSSRRQELMKLLGIPFEVIASDFDETSVKHTNPKKLVEKLAIEKARTVAKSTKNSIVIGSDTVVYNNGAILGKPRDKNHAKEILTALSNQDHLIVTGYAIIDSDTKEIVSGVVSAKVKMKELSGSEIDEYIATGEPMDKAGAYAIQGIGGIFIEKMNGNYFDVVGLPLVALRRELRKFGIKILE